MKTHVALVAVVVVFVARAGDPTQLDPLSLDTISLTEARKLDGQPVCILFTSETPVFECQGQTIAGPDSADAAVVRAVHFRGLIASKIEKWEGKPIRVVGVLRVVDYPTMVTAGQQLDAWSAIRIEGATLAP